jgi:hypothetical protein
MVNVLENAVWVFLVVMMFLGLGIGFSIVDRIFTNTTAILNTTLQNVSGQNYMNVSNPNYNMTKLLYIDRFQDYSDMRALWLQMINFVVVMLIAFLFLSSFTQNLDVVEYAYMFVASLFITAILSYLITMIYNGIATQFTDLGFDLTTFSSWFIGNYQAILVLNILAFIGNVVFQKMRGRQGVV